MSTPSVEIVKAIPQAQDVFLPVMTIEVAVERRETIVKFVQQIMVKDQDFGVIPGTGSKPVLLKPGAEKLANFFGLEPEFTPIAEEVDWTGEKHGGEPFYYIRYRCRLTRNGQVLGVGEGSCNSWESKYRYRNANRKCPQCAGEFIIKGREEYGGGWLCFARKGGCGAKFSENDKSITEQVVGRVKNPDVADSVNTIQKMAQKRALVPAVLLATSGSEFFTQDLEDAEPSHQQNTPEQQAELAQRRIQETRGDGPSQGAAQSPAAEGHPPTPTEAAPVIPGPLKALWDNIYAQKPGAVRQAFDFMKAQLREASPEYGATEYKRIVAKYDESHPGVKPAKVYWECILALWETGEAFRAAAREAAGGYQGTDADIPFEAEPEQAALLPEVAK